MPLSYGARIVLLLALGGHAAWLKGQGRDKEPSSCWTGYWFDRCIMEMWAKLLLRGMVGVRCREVCAQLEVSGDQILRQQP